MSVTVCKLGGSLLTLPDLRLRLNRFLDTLHDQQVLFVVGGGATADVVREWDRRHALSSETAHGLALSAMMLNEALVLDLLSDARLVGDRNEAERTWREGRSAILCASRFLNAEERVARNSLPHTWDVTSDSIAAWVACRWPADRLVLLKSAPLSPRASSTAEPNPELVDAYFSKIVPKLSRIDWVNLRDDHPELVPYQTLF